MVIFWYTDFFCIHFQTGYSNGWSFLILPYVSGLPDFAEVYSFIGSVFDPDTNDHIQRLKEMDPINFETVSLILYWNFIIV